MPKTIDYPRTSYAGAWEVAEVVDDTGGKCSIEACARKLNRKVSGSFKAILGSAVKFGLLTSKRELLTTTNLFRRIKHAYDKQEELLYHREAFLHPPLFSQISRKFRNKELPVQMFDIMLIREFGVEEINAQNVAKAFIDGARMAGILDERNVVADIDQLAAQQGPRRELASGEMPLNLFKASDVSTAYSVSPATAYSDSSRLDPSGRYAIDSTLPETSLIPASPPESLTEATMDSDPVSALFGLNRTTPNPAIQYSPETAVVPPVILQAAAANPEPIQTPAPRPASPAPPRVSEQIMTPPTEGYLIHIAGPGLDTQLSIQDVDDLEIVRILLEKIRKNLTNK
ncbi:hypothetical protein KBK19_17040 [Microvirga sp. STR05]|uniref:Uncharacterized protein n=1 Tax=Hymenobacter duratus TaxID=2771356 RepID=A0ABR8JIS5_9BACT|nr:hypothetical protein [Hymenobacter duratus]MBD2716753.1 hypothetical protein [Hymenobacter duratus]MBR7951668.1 hypothetical protein [Microvirga sp. STR05]